MNTEKISLALALLQNVPKDELIRSLRGLSSDPCRVNPETSSSSGSSVARQSSVSPSQPSPPPDPRVVARTQRLLATRMPSFRISDTQESTPTQTHDRYKNDVGPRTQRRESERPAYSHDRHKEDAWSRSQGRERDRTLYSQDPVLFSFVYLRFSVRS